MIKLFKPYVSWRAIWNVFRVLRSGQLAEGPQVKAFEREFAARFNLKNVLALNSGTTALELAYELAGIKEGDEVIVPVLTCTATNLPLVHRKAKIVFADIDYSLNIDPDDVERRITAATKAIVFVHLGGDDSGVERIREIANERNIILIEDAAQAVGGNISNAADFTAISLQAIKSLTAGDGGFLVCKRTEDYELGKRLRWFGYDREAKQRLGDIDLLEAGWKWHMNDISAAIGRGNLSKIDKILDHRRKLMKIYGRLKLFRGDTWVFPSLWATKVLDPSRPWTEWKHILRDICEVGQYHYRNDKYSVFGGRASHPEAESPLPHMDYCEDHYFFLPMHEGVSEDDARDIVERIGSHIMSSI